MYWYSQSEDGAELDVAQEGGGDGGAGAWASRGASEAYFEALTLEEVPVQVPDSRTEFWQAAVVAGGGDADHAVLH